MHSRSRRRCIRVAGPRDDDEFGQPQQILPAVPTGDFRERIGADDEIRLLAERAHALHRVDRIALAFSLFQTRSDETRIRLAGQFRHAEAVFVRGAGVIGFVRRMGGRNEPYLLQIEIVRRLRAPP